MSWLAGNKGLNWGLQDRAECQGLDLEEVPRRTELSAAVQPGQPFLSVEPPHGHSLLCRVKKGYNMRFDRSVILQANQMTCKSQYYKIISILRSVVLSNKIF